MSRVSPPLWMADGLGVKARIPESVVQPVIESGGAGGGACGQGGQAAGDAWGGPGEVDPDEVTPCPVCGSLAFREPVIGERLCQDCHPATKSMALADLARRFRARAHVRAGR